MIRRLLIANRGEIALRVIRACRELGVETVAVYSDADAAAPHALAGDRAVRIGAAPAAESYLRANAIVAAAREAGADAVHPGYGFLAENAAFAAACAEAGLIFVGPSPAAIEGMGSKIESRRRARQAGIPVVPGETPAAQDPASLAAAAGRLGFPLLVKASAGGGGKGMRVVRAPEALEEAIEGARHEAGSAFGDDTLYLERLLERPRHVEVQVFGDDHGRVVSLFERDCSTQRRHQKIVEESPSPALTPGLRRRMCEAAVALARHIGYAGAGTVEFLVEGEGDAASFYFLEMNTRLQVEHPVTEAITGLDLVHAQLVVASGGPLPWAPGAIEARGHAIECRVYAEDPAADFLPQAGTLAVYREPRIPGVRVDGGVAEGGEVTVYYDPLLAKLIAHGETREMARRRAIEALKQYVVLGIRTNIPFLVRVLESDRFREGRVDTSYLDADGAALREPTRRGLAPAIAAAVVAELQPATPPANGGRGGPPAAATGAWPMPSDARGTADPWLRLQGWRM
jgi:acetyl-CoA carboxylase biotin carboxylase subunit